MPKMRNFRNDKIIFIVFDRSTENFASEAQKLRNRINRFMQIPLYTVIQYEGRVDGRAYTVSHQVRNCDESVV